MFRLRDRDRLIAAVAVASVKQPHSNFQGKPFYAYTGELLMKLVSKTFTALSTLALSLGLTHVAFALDPTTLYQRSSPAVVSISAPNGKSFNYGSGFIADSKGLILTNQHVVGKNKQVAIKLADGSIYSGIVVSRSAQVDLALVQIRPEKPLPSLSIQAVPPKIGQKAYAIGDPKGLERSLSDGIVSRIDYSGLIQFTATASFGSSGGPLLNEDGQVIGIVQGGNPGTNLNFAIPAAAINNLPGQRSITAQQISNYSNPNQVVRIRRSY
ncbi:S1C family serine protease [Trichocoleus sp. FACHB-262]|uniref:S1C family serine protease n=1 Tax=Trichocoleus sp. FACHB-262 TaxID=2692869 RepID=UPI001683DF15|nr:serine protease [Trichocoleus sp. FACHB-262]